MSTRPAAAYLDIATEIAAVLRVTYGRHGGSYGGWHILVAPEVQFGATALVPDVAGWRRERLPELPREGVVDTVPDWVCEVFRPGCAREQRVEKAQAYVRAGVRWLWRVHADDGVLEAAENRDGAWSIRSAHGDDVARVAPFDAIEIEFTRVFADQRARLSNSRYTSPHPIPSSVISTDR